MNGTATGKPGVAHLEVEVATPKLPLVLADAAFLTTLSQVERDIAHLKVDTPESAEGAATLQNRLTTAGKKLDAARLALKRPFLDINAKIDETARAPMERIEAAKALIKRALTAWDAEQRKQAEAAERARQAELARLERLRQEEEARERKKAEEEARAAEAAAKKNAAPVMDVDFDDDVPQPPPPKTDIEKQIEAVKFAPAVAVARPAGIRYKTTLVPVVEDINKVPDIFLIKTVNMQALRATFCNGWSEGEPIPTCDGIKFEVKRDAVSSGR